MLRDEPRVLQPGRMHGVERNALEAVAGDGPTDNAQHQDDDLLYPDDDIRSILLLRYGKYLQWKVINTYYMNKGRKEI